MKKIISLFSVLAVLFIFSSCEKEDRFIDTTAQGNSPGVGFASTLTNAVSLDVTPDTPFLVIPITAFYSSSSGGAGGNISVSIIVDTNVVNAYNATTGDAQIPIPESSIASAPSSIDISSGSHEGSSDLVISLDTLLKYGTSFAVGVQITDVNGSSLTSRDQQVYLINIRNLIDGEYEVNGSFTDTYITTITDDGVYPIDAYLITKSANSVQFYDKGDELSGKLINSSGVFSYYGGFVPIFTIDLTTGDVTNVTNAYSVTDPLNPNKRTAKLDATGVNKYDFSTKTLKVSYILVQNIIAPDFERTFFNETYTYVGPRN